jgi:NRPS condensation-like uncharacterized protein
VGGTVNDILMAVCYRSIDEWNRRHGKRTRKISFLVPIDIGSPDLNGIISNQISYISFSTSAKDRVDPTRLLRRVSAERIYMLKERRGNTYSIVYFASVLRRLPLAAMKVCSKPSAKRLRPSAHPRWVVRAERSLPVIRRHPQTPGR